MRQTGWGGRAGGVSPLIDALFRKCRQISRLTPAARLVHFNEVLATIYRQLGVPTDRVHADAFGRAVPVLYEHDAVIGELL